MFEKPVASTLIAYLSRFVSGIDEEQLSVSLWSGRIALYDLHPKSNILDELMALAPDGAAGGTSVLPLTVLSGTIRELEIVIPWTAIESEPVSIAVHDLSIVVGPQRSASSDAEESAITVEKERLLRLFETLVNNHLTGSPAMPATQKPESPSRATGYLETLIPKILRNVHLTLINVHLSGVYDYDSLHPSFSSFASIFVKEAFVVTTDELLQDRYVFDLSVPFYKKVEAFDVSVIVGEERKDGAVHSDYDFSLSHRENCRKNWNVCSSLIESEQLGVSFCSPHKKVANGSFDVAFGFRTCFAASLDAAESIHKLYHALKDSFKFARWKQFLKKPSVSEPEENPSALRKSLAAERWRFAYSCICSNIRAKKSQFKMSYSALGELRRRYCELYKMALQCPWLPPYSAASRASLVDIESKLTVEQILFFRSLCRSEIVGESELHQLQQMYVSDAKKRMPSRVANAFKWFRSQKGQQANASPSAEQQTDGVATSTAKGVDFSTLEACWEVANKLLSGEATSPPSWISNISWRISCDSASIELAPYHESNRYSPLQPTETRSASFLHRIQQTLVFKVYDVEMAHLNEQRLKFSVGSLSGCFSGLFHSPLIDSRSSLGDKFVSVLLNYSDRSGVVRVSPSVLLIRPHHEVLWWIHELRHRNAWLANLFQTTQSPSPLASRSSSGTRTPSAFQLDIHVQQTTIALPTDASDSVENMTLLHGNHSIPVGCLSMSSSLTENQFSEHGSQEPCLEHNDNNVDVAHHSTFIIRTPPMEAKVELLGSTVSSATVTFDGDTSVACQREDSSVTSSLVHLDVIQISSISVVMSTNAVNVFVNKLDLSFNPTVLALIHDAFVNVQSTAASSLLDRTLEDVSLLSMEWKLRHRNCLTVRGKDTNWPTDRSRDFVTVLFVRYFDECAPPLQERRTVRRTIPNLTCSMNCVHYELRDDAGNCLTEVEVLPAERELCSLYSNLGVEALKTHSYPIQLSIRQDRSVALNVAYLDVNSSTGKKFLYIESLSLQQLESETVICDVASIAINVDDALIRSLNVAFRVLFSFVPSDAKLTAPRTKPARYSVTVHQLSVELPVCSGMNETPLYYLTCDYRSISCQYVSSFDAAESELTVNGVISEIRATETIPIKEFILVSASQNFVGDARDSTFTFVVKRAPHKPTRSSFSLKGGQITAYFPLIWDVSSQPFNSFYESLFTALRNGLQSTGFSFSEEPSAVAAASAECQAQTTETPFLFEAFFHDVELFVAANASMPVNTADESTFFFIYVGASKAVIQSGVTVGMTSASFRLREMYYFPQDNPTQLELLLRQFNLVYEWSHVDQFYSMRTETPSPTEIDLKLSVESFETFFSAFMLNYLAPTKITAFKPTFAKVTMEEFTPRLQMQIFVSDERRFFFQWNDGLLYRQDNDEVSFSFKNCAIETLEPGGSNGSLKRLPILSLSSFAIEWDLSSHLEPQCVYRCDGFAYTSNSQCLLDFASVFSFVPTVLEAFRRSKCETTAVSSTKYVLTNATFQWKVHSVECAHMTVKMKSLSAEYATGGDFIQIDAQMEDIGILCGSDTDPSRSSAIFSCSDAMFTVKSDPHCEYSFLLPYSVNAAVNSPTVYMEWECCAALRLLFCEMGNTTSTSVPKSAESDELERAPSKAHCYVPSELEVEITNGTIYSSSHMGKLIVGNLRVEQNEVKIMEFDDSLFALHVTPTMEISNTVMAMERHGGSIDLLNLFVHVDLPLPFVVSPAAGSQLSTSNQTTDDDLLSKTDSKDSNFKWFIRSTTSNAELPIHLCVQASQRSPIRLTDVMARAIMGELQREHSHFLSFCEDGVKESTEDASSPFASLTMKFLLLSFDLSLEYETVGSAIVKIAQLKISDAVELNVTEFVGSDLTASLIVRHFQLLDGHSNLMLSTSSKSVPTVVLKVNAKKQLIHVESTMEGLCWNASFIGRWLQTAKQFSGYFDVITSGGGLQLPQSTCWLHRSVTSSATVRATQIIIGASVLQCEALNAETVVNGSHTLLNADTSHVISMKNLLLKTRGVHAALLSVDSAEVKGEDETISIRLVALRVRDCTSSGVLPELITEVLFLKESMSSCMQLPSNVEEDFSQYFVVSVRGIDIRALVDDQSLDTYFQVTAPGALLKTKLTSEEVNHSFEIDNLDAHYFSPLGTAAILVCQRLSLALTENAATQSRTITSRSKVVRLTVPTGALLQQCATDIIAIFSPYIALLHRETSHAPVTHSRRDTFLLRFPQPYTSSRYVSYRCSVLFPEVTVSLHKGGDASHPVLASLTISSVSCEHNVSSSCSSSIFQCKSVSSTTHPTLFQGPWIGASGNSNAVDPLSQEAIYVSVEKVRSELSRMVNADYVPFMKSDVMARFMSVRLTLSSELLAALESNCLLPLVAVHSTHYMANDGDVELTKLNMNRKTLTSDWVLSSDVWAGGRSGVVLHFKKLSPDPHASNVINVTSINGAKLHLSPVLTAASPACIVVDEGLIVNFVGILVDMDFMTLQDAVTLGDRSVVKLPSEQIIHRSRSTAASAGDPSSFESVVQELNIDMKGGLSVVLWSQLETLTVSSTAVLNYHLEKASSGSDRNLVQYMDERGSLEWSSVYLDSSSPPSSAATNEFCFIASVEHHKLGQSSGLSSVAIQLPDVHLLLHVEQLQLVLRIGKLLHHLHCHLQSLLPMDESATIDEGLTTVNEDEQLSLVKMTVNGGSFVVSVASDLLTHPLCSLEVLQLTCAVSGNRDGTQLSWEASADVKLIDFPEPSTQRSLLSCSPHGQWSSIHNGCSSSQIILRCTAVEATVPLLTVHQFYHWLRSVSTEDSAAPFVFSNQLGRGVAILFQTHARLLPPGETVVDKQEYTIASYFHVLLGEKKLLCSLKEEVQEAAHLVDLSNFEKASTFRVALLPHPLGVLDTVFRYDASSRHMDITSSVRLTNGFTKRSVHISSDPPFSAGESRYVSLDALTLPFTVGVGTYRVSSFDSAFSLEGIVSSFLTLPSDQFVASYPGVKDGRVLFSDGDTMVKLHLLLEASSIQALPNQPKRLVCFTIEREVAIRFNRSLPSADDVQVTVGPVLIVTNLTGMALNVSSLMPTLLPHGESVDYFPSIESGCENDEWTLDFCLVDPRSGCPGAQLNVDVSAISVGESQLISLPGERERVYSVKRSDATRVMICAVGFVASRLPWPVAVQFIRGDAHASPVVIDVGGEVAMTLPGSDDTNGAYSIGDHIHMRISPVVESEEEHDFKWSETCLCNPLLEPTLITQRNANSWLLHVMVVPKFTFDQPSDISVPRIVLTSRWRIYNALPISVEVSFNSSVGDVARRIFISAGAYHDLLELPAVDGNLQCRPLLDTVTSEWSPFIRLSSLWDLTSPIRWKSNVSSPVCLPNLSSYKMSRVPTHPLSPPEIEHFLNLCFSSVVEDSQSTLAIFNDDVLPLLVENRTKNALQIREMAAKSLSLSKVSRTWAYFVPPYSDSFFIFETLSVSSPPIRFQLWDEHVGSALEIANLKASAASGEVCRLGECYLTVLYKEDLNRFVVTVDENRCREKHRIASCLRTVVNVDFLIDLVTLYIACPLGVKGSEKTNEPYFRYLYQKCGLRIPPPTDSSDTAAATRNMHHFFHHRELDVFCVEIVGWYGFACCNEKQILGNASFGQLSVLDCTHPDPVHPIVLQLMPRAAATSSAKSRTAFSLSTHLAPPQTLLCPSRGRKSGSCYVRKVSCHSIEAFVGDAEVRISDAFLYTLQCAIKRAAEDYWCEDDTTSKVSTSQLLSATVYDFYSTSVWISGFRVCVTLSRRSNHHPYRFPTPFSLPIPAVEAASLSFPGVKLKECQVRSVSPAAFFIDVLWPAYRTSVYLQIFKLVGSLEALGNPLAFVSGWARGFKALLLFTLDRDLLSGVHGLLSHAASSTLHSIGLVSHFGSQVTAKLSFDERVLHSDLQGGPDGFIAAVAGDINKYVAHPIAGVLRRVGNSAQSVSLLLRTVDTPSSTVKSYRCRNRNFASSAQCE